MTRGENHQNLRPWRAGGASPNPGGRPKGLTALLKRKYGKDGKRLVDELHLIAFDRSLTAKIRVQALNSLLDRGWGRPAQPVDLNQPLGTVFLMPPGSMPDLG